MRHLDLFSGIGGFSLAVDRVWYEQKNEHIFVEWNLFCQEVLKKHWGGAELHHDIRKFVADSKGRIEQQLAVERKQNEKINPTGETYLLTGGFPCQPFSQAGRRKGTADDRYLWPPMLECISLFRPRWVIAENVAGLVTWSDGMVLETVCSDLEKEGYEVRPFVIPAVSVGAPHRRDRVWIVANAKHPGSGYPLPGRHDEGVSAGIAGSDTYAPNTRGEGRQQKPRGAYGDEGANERRPKIQADQPASNNQDAPHPESKRRENAGTARRRRAGPSHRSERWDKQWLEVATRLCRMDDGVPRRMDRNPRLKALGNAIVPQIAEEIMRAIKTADWYE